MKGYSPQTQNGYLRCARTFARHFMRSPEEMGSNAVKFLYSVTLKRAEAVKDISHPKRPKTLPVILSPEDVLSVFERVRSVKFKAVIATAYAAGLRISEVCTLKVTDIDSARMRIHIRSGKGKKDRYVMLGESLLALLREYYRTAAPPSTTAIIRIS